MARRLQQGNCSKASVAGRAWWSDKGMCRGACDGHATLVDEYIGERQSCDNGERPPSKPPEYIEHCGHCTVFLEYFSGIENGRVAITVCVLCFWSSY